MTEILISNTPFPIPSFTLHYENRIVKFTPVFLYGQGVTGCVETTLLVGGQSSALGRLFMRSVESAEWTYTSDRKPAGQRAAFDEDDFFAVVDALLP